MVERHPRQRGAQRGRGTHGKDALDVKEIYDGEGATAKETSGD